MSQDMVQAGYEMQWGAKGRDDLGMMQTLGANTVRLYHTLGAPGAESAPHDTFLDRAYELGIHVMPGFHTPMDCPDDDCFDAWRAATLAGFSNGFLKSGAWHPAVSAVVLLNEPDFTPCPNASLNYCRVKRCLSALEGVLAAETEKAVEGSVMLTVTWSFAESTSIDGVVKGPGIFGFQDMVAGVKNPSLAKYTPRNATSLEEAFEKRWMHGMNTQAPWSYVKQCISSHYDQFLPKKWFIGEYGANGQSQAVITNDTKEMDSFAASDQGFAGVNVFQFQTAYAKGGSELNFGLFSLGDQKIGDTGNVPNTYPVYCLNVELPWFNKAGHPEMSRRAEAVASGWGGSAEGHGRCNPFDDAPSELLV